ncbi:DUF397 domain-containing protein [Streptomyces sp. NPDC004667]|uniref:DUF397 domain-containing protein n=1 Tax=Streptomyces sp. NPDC004667 TaxID=3154285 RepID=UPI0033A9E419
MPESDWQRSSYCAEGSSCVYVATSHEGRVLIADDPAPRTTLALSPAAWAVFLGTVRGNGA